MTHSPSHALVRNRLKTRHALLLVAMADTLNMHRAAAQLGMTQPAASRLLKEMESMLDVELFARLSRGLQPTWYGEIMIRHARAILASMDQAQEEIAGFREGLTGVVHLGTILGPGATLIPKVIARLLAIAPKVQVSVVVDVSGRLNAQLQEGLLDIVVARLVEDPGHQWAHFEYAGTESIAVVARLGHPLMQIHNLGLGDLMDTRWILPPPGGLLRPKFDLLCRQAGLEPPQNAVETVAMPVISNLLEQTDMVAAIGTEVADHYAKHGMLGFLPININCQMEPYGIITRHGTALPPSAMVVLDLLRSHALAPQDHVGGAL
jgi:DNA-binding transcriptional LysR family regulator